MGEQAGDEVLALALPDQVDVRDLVVARLEQQYFRKKARISFQKAKISGQMSLTNKGVNFIVICSSRNSLYLSLAPFVDHLVGGGNPIYVKCTSILEKPLKTIRFEGVRIKLRPQFFCASAMYVSCDFCKISQI